MHWVLLGLALLGVGCSSGRSDQEFYEKCLLMLAECKLGLAAPTVEVRCRRLTAARVYKPLSHREEMDSMLGQFGDAFRALNELDPAQEAQPEISMEEAVRMFRSGTGPSEEGVEESVDPVTESDTSP